MSEIRNTCVENKLANIPEPLRSRLSQLRALVHSLAERSDAIGDIQESLKWGQISFATCRPKSGTPIRIDGDLKAKTYSLFVPCSTSLIEDFRTHHPDMFDYYGNREIRLDLDRPLPKNALTIFI
ncbi:MAG TPA: DUF1801 domain-containing protein, partial [Hellea balneolensis]|nr:DUF1801 domain-containing protein [Hellea balneolensis]